ncbi:DUF2927 domain-containing protein [Flavobacteriaceae bacterium R38]|nr:DUF2927 domain-containing protein [Flavobacteriaceae bacterium R38]NAS29703.1 DUF2927 domain-containing protein [Flavobacteriaceae bacterium R38]
MSNKKMGLVILLIVLSLGFFLYQKFIRIDYEPTAYESELIEYFKEVALKSEFDENVNKIIKWRKPMRLYVVTDKNQTYEKQMFFIQNAINSFNTLATDGFKIELSDDFENSNSYLYLCSREKIAKVNPNFYQQLTDNLDDNLSGFVYMEFYWTSYNIYRSSIFIDINDSLVVQESTILEEITQSTGLPNDPESHKNSIFYEHKSDEDINIKEYSDLDKDVIKLLYHPRMKPGLNSKQVERVIMKILKNREIKLSGE